MATALLDASVQDRVSALRKRVTASREKATDMFDGLRQQATPLPLGIDEMIAGIRGKVAMLDDTSTGATPTSGLPMMAGAKHNQK